MKAHPKPTPSSLPKRQNIYMKRPTVLFAIRQAIKLGLIHGPHGKKLESADQWIETELMAKLREVAPKLRRELYQLGILEQRHAKDGILEAATK